MKTIRYYFPFGNVPFRDSSASAACCAVRFSILAKAREKWQRRHRQRRCLKRKKIIGSAWLSIVLLFIYSPILILAVYSFSDTPTIGASGNFSIQNYVKLFTTPELQQMILGTLTLALKCAVISTILGTLGAIGAFYSKKGIRGFVVASNQIPVANADVVTGFSVCVLLIVVFGNG